MKNILEKVSKNPYSLTPQEVMKLQEEVLGFKRNSNSIANRADGKMGTYTIKALQRKVGTKDDGYWGNDSKKQYKQFLTTAPTIPIQKQNPKVESKTSWLEDTPIIGPLLEKVSTVVPIPTPKNTPKVASVPEMPVVSTTPVVRTTPILPTVESPYYIVAKPQSVESGWNFASKMEEEAKAAGRATASFVESIDPRDMAALLDPQTNNDIRTRLKLPLVAKSESNPYKLLDDRFLYALSTKVNPKHSLPAYSVSPRLLNNVYSYDWGDGYKVPKYTGETLPEGTNHAIWMQGYSSPGTDAKQFNEEEQIQNFLKYNPQHQKAYDAYTKQKNDKAFQDARKQAGYGQILTPEEHAWHNIMLHNAVLAGQRQNRDTYTQFAENGGDPWMGDSSIPLVAAADANGVSTAYGASGVVYPDRTQYGKEHIPGYFSRYGTTNDRINFGRYAIGAPLMPGGTESISRYQPVLTTYEQTSNQDSSQPTYAITSKTAQVNWDPYTMHAWMQTPGAQKMAERARAPYNYIPEKWMPNIGKKVVATGGGEIPQQLEALSAAGATFRPNWGTTIDPAKVAEVAKKTGQKPKWAYQMYDPNGGGNVTVWFDPKTGKVKSVTDAQDWDIGIAQAGISGSGKVVVTNPNYVNPIIADADAWQKQYYANRKAAEKISGIVQQNKELQEATLKPGSGVLATSDNNKNVSPGISYSSVVPLYANYTTVPASPIKKEV